MKDIHFFQLFFGHLVDTSLSLKNFVPNLGKEEKLRFRKIEDQINEIFTELRKTDLYAEFMDSKD